MIRCMALQSQISDETLASMLFPDLINYQFVGKSSCVLY